MQQLLRRERSARLRIANMAHGKPVGGDRGDVFKPAFRTRKVKCVDQNSGILAVCSVDDPLGLAQIRYDRPRKELKQHRKIVAAREIGKRSEPLGKSSKVCVVLRGKNVSRAQFCPRCREWLQRRYIDRRRNLDKLDATYTQSATVAVNLRRAHT